MSDGDNYLSWLTGDTDITFSLDSPKALKHMKELQEEYPDQVGITVNEDGTVYGHCPLKWLKIKPKIKMDLTEEERARRRERYQKNGKMKNNRTDG